MLLKLRQYEKATKFEKISHLFLLSSVKTSGRFFQNFVAFSEKLDFECTGKSLSEALLHQLTHNMTTGCSLNYKFNTGKFKTQTWGEHVVYRNCF